MLDPGSVVTFDRIEGYRVLEKLGAVCGQTTLPRDTLSVALRFVGGLMGMMSPAEYLTDIERARPECLRSLLRNAERLGANGILGVRFDSVEVTGGSRQLRATGEAVILESSGEVK